MSSNTGVLGRVEAGGRSGLPGKLLLLILFVAGITLWMAVLFEVEKDFPHEMLLAFSAIVVGLGSGLGARLAFGDRTGGLQVAGALAMHVAGLLALGFLTNWKLGIGPVEFWRDRIDTLEATQVGAGALASLLALSAWRRPVRMRAASTGTRAIRPASAERVAATPRSSSPAFVSAPASRARPATRRGSVVSRGLGSILGSKRRGGKLSIRRPARTSVSRRRGPFRRRPEVQLSVYEEHKCPYCLEDVKRNDPRGTKECPICHTLHHADCWAVTGMCQVPHLTA